MKPNPLALYSVIVTFVIVVAALRGVSHWSLIALCVIAMVCGAALMFREEIGLVLARKTEEWRNDTKQLGLWTKLAFRSDRSLEDTATMTHQMAFLRGRLMSPMNLFAVAIIAILLLPLVFGFQEWRIGRVKAERDAPCSDRELTSNSDGSFKTTRQACASLGAQTISAREWRTRAIEAEAARIRDIAQIRLDNELARIAERERRARVEASNARQRRRQDEVIVAALGGPSPDLERSLCELAGSSSCPQAGDSSAAGEPTPSGAVPSGAASDPSVSGPSPSSGGSSAVDPATP